ncbi:hypothetical protein [Acetobacter malorum]|nr:hypothetical protein [Acetobacter malorum]
MMRRSLSFLSGLVACIWVVSAFSIFAPSAYAGVSGADMQQAGMSADLVQYAQAVSANEGSWSTESSKGCLGAFQFCPGTFEEYYSGTKDQFLHDPQGQVNAYKRYVSDSWRRAQRNGLTSAIGKSVCWQNACTTITESSVLMACQFGCGSDGKLAHFVKNGYSCTGAFNTADGYGTSVCKYLLTGANYNVSAITGDPNDASAPVQCLADLSSVQLYLSVPYGSARAGDGTGGNTWDSHSIGLAANGSATGDNTPQVKAGTGGTAQWLPSSTPGGSSVVVSDGSIRTTYNNLSNLAGAVNTNPTVQRSQVLGLMTNTGTTGKPGFGLSMAVRQDVLKSAGLAGRAGFDVPCPDCSVAATGNSALASDKLGDAASRSFYYVNPESFLGRSVSVLPEAMQAYPQAFAGRSSTTSLPSSCSASRDALARSSPNSGGAGASLAGGTDGVAGYRLGTEDFSVNQAQQAERALWMELAHSEADDLRVTSRDLAAQDTADSGVAHLQIMETNK